jgi:hypothetical protein
MHWLHFWLEGPTVSQYYLYQSHFQVKVNQTIITVYSLLWTYTTAMLALCTGIERTMTLDSWCCPDCICHWHLLALQVWFIFTCACVALAILQVPNKRIKFWTKDCLPLITNIWIIFPQNRFGWAWLPIYFSETGQLVIQSYLQTTILCFDCIYRMCYCSMCCDHWLVFAATQWLQRIEGGLGTGNLSPGFMICWTGSCVLTADLVFIARGSTHLGIKEFLVLENVNQFGLCKLISIP